MKTSLTLFILILALSCKKDGVKGLDGAVKAKVCGVEYPARQLPWLYKIIEDAKAKKEEDMLTIKLVEVKGKPVFNYYVSYMSCIGCISYDCDGARIDLSKTFSEEELKQYQQNLGNGSGKVTVIWPE